MLPGGSVCVLTDITGNSFKCYGVNGGHATYTMHSITWANGDAWKKEKEAKDTSERWRWTQAAVPSSARGQKATTTPEKYRKQDGGKDVVKDAQESRAQRQV